MKKPYDFQEDLDRFISKVSAKGVSVLEISEAFKIEAARMDKAVLEITLRASAKAVAGSL